MSHIFISYSTKNSDYAYKLADKLREEGFDVWIDNKQLRNSDNWWESIVKALRVANAFVVVMTPESRDSKWVQREVALADEWGKPAFPLLLNGEKFEIYVLTQLEDVQNGQLPPDKFYEDLERSTHRKRSRGSNVVKKKSEVPIDDTEVQKAIENPPQKQPWWVEHLREILIGIIVVVMGGLILNMLIQPPKDDLVQLTSTNTAIPSNTPTNTVIPNTPTNTVIPSDTPTETSVPPTETDTPIPTETDLPTITPTITSTPIPILRHCYPDNDVSESQKWILDDGRQIDVCPVSENDFSLFLGDDTILEQEQLWVEADDAGVFGEIRNLFLASSFTPENTYYTSTFLEWYIATAYCRWRGAETEMRLPTIAELELLLPILTGLEFAQPDIWEWTSDDTENDFEFLRYHPDSDSVAERFRAIRSDSIGFGCVQDSMIEGE